MTNILIMFSLLLNGIAFFAIIILYLRQNRLLQVEQRQEKLLQEMEEVMSTSLIEMNEENEKFIRKMREFLPKIQESAKNIHPTEDFVMEKDGHEELLEVEQDSFLKEPTQTFRKGSVYQAVQAYKNVPKQEVSDEPDTVLSKEKQKNSEELFTKSSYSQALLLREQGLSTEEIAKKLKKGKTEIELLLKLRQNKEE